MNIDILKEANPLIIVNQQDAQFLNLNDCKYPSIVVDYERIYGNDFVSQLEKKIASENNDFLIFSSNFLRHLYRFDKGPLLKRFRLGYSSFGGIDLQNTDEQTLKNFNALTSDPSNNYVPGIEDLWVNDESPTRNGTFSLIFDTEQVGCVGIGLERILSLLNKKHCVATFFFTNFVGSIYPQIFEQVHKLGHEVALHGLYHEFLSKRDLNLQDQMIHRMKEHIRVPVYGANFISRMNSLTLEAMFRNDIHYTVFPSIQNFLLGRFGDTEILPYVVRNEQGKMLVMFPVQVETYGREFLPVKGMVTSVYNKLRKTSFSHMTILLHPFRDGSLHRIKELNKLIEYLQDDLDLKAITLRKASENVLSNGSLLNDRKIILPVEDKIFSGSRQFRDILTGKNKRNTNLITVLLNSLVPKNKTDLVYLPVMIRNNMRLLLAHRRHMIRD
ncbi:putative polysaccharide deacetylase [Candidatus Nitrososphaera gargensis Ga9.2]|uniref:Putative polysaccharide deacetylase n=1 Tax=Nitrososphaera gargensis (strain Ga9.2) TaxID=1237085 RepID=K0IIF8_NITGG|nr:polysaccharide deacetylase family protein [Candidatus Nitrososphaera gargensis]AFU57837.1 putative polysaccharide deacetylase [Candidatus Nitrososphaera gargensis Ga9.2]